MTKVIFALAAIFCLSTAEARGPISPFYGCTFEKESMFGTEVIHIDCNDRWYSCGRSEGSSELEFCEGGLREE